MPKTIYDVKTADLIPQNMLTDPCIVAKCAALDAMDTIETAQISKAYILAKIESQSESVIDALAIERHVDYYNQTLSLDIKRSLVAESGFHHRIKGTKAAVEQVAQLVFGSASMQEWFEYGGSPGHFRMLINEFPNAESQMDEIKRAVASAQRRSAILDEVDIIAATASSPVYMAGVFQMAVYVNMTQQAAGG